MSPALLTAVNATSHIHLIIGSNPLAGARCTRSLEVGAQPVLLAVEDSTLHYGLERRIEAGEVKWLKRGFQDEDLTTLGRAEVDGVVDAVFVTAGGKNSLGTFTQKMQKCFTKPPQLRTFLTCAGDCAYLSTSRMRRTCAPSHFSRHTRMVLCRLA